MKVRTRMMIAFLAMGVLGFVFLMDFVDRKVKPVYLKPIEDDLADFANILAELVTVSPDGNLDLSQLEYHAERARQRELDAEIYNYRKTAINLIVYATDAQGRVIYHSNDPEQLGESYEWMDVTRTLRKEYGARATWQRQPQAESQLVLFVGAPILDGKRIVGVVSVGKSTPQAYSMFKGMEHESIVGISLAVVLATVWGLLFSAWITGPIRRLTEYVQAVRDGKKVELPKLGKSDIGTLGSAFEEMRDALEGKKYVEDYVQTLTHEIKSPLSGIKGAAELLHEDMPPQRRERFLHNIHTETNRIQKIVDRLLELSAIESRKGLKDPNDLDLVTLLRQLIEDMRPQTEACNVTVELQGLEQSMVRGERFLIQLALSNLLQNAVEFTPPGGTVTVAVEQGKLRIADTGPGVPEYALQRVFERFYSLSRPDTGKKSSGLGLSIVRSVAELHNGSIILRNRPQGGAEAEWNFS